MNSSTSSSRKIYTKIFLAITLGMGLAMALINLVTWLHDASAETIMGRVVEARAALPRIVGEDKDLVMVFGSSMVAAGFSPRQFDQAVNARGKNVKSFNFGFGGLNPFFQDYLSRRIREEFQENDRKLKLAIIEFNPFQATKARWQGALPIVDSFITMLANDRELVKIAVDDPERGALLFNIKYARNDISAEMITSFYGREIFPDSENRDPDEPEEIVKRREELGNELTELFEKEYPDYEESNWSYEWQGGGTIPEERSARTLEVFDLYNETLRTDPMMQARLDARISSADILGLHFEPLLIDSFINIVKNFKQFSDQVEVVMLPRNTQWVQYSDETKARLASTIAKIEKETGLKIRNHQEIPEITPDMYRDATHLVKYRGESAYTYFLAREFESEL